MPPRGTGITGDSLASGVGIERCVEPLGSQALVLLEADPDVGLVEADLVALRLDFELDLLAVLWCPEVGVVACRYDRAVGLFALRCDVDDELLPHRAAVLRHGCSSHA